MTERVTSTDELQVEIDLTECCASGMCASIAPTAFEIDSAGYAIALPSAATTDPETVIRAARNCPTLCITLSRDNHEIDLFA